MKLLHKKLILSLLCSIFACIFTLPISFPTFAFSIATNETSIANSLHQTKQSSESKPVPEIKIKPQNSITGNPIGNRINYTINGLKERNLSVECVFINSGDKPVKLNIWTIPNEVDPQETILLDKGLAAKPFQVLKSFHFKLKNEWWCRIFTPNNTHLQWKHCTYFSISDADIIKHNPFGTWKIETQSSDTSYHCRIKKPDKNTSFFYFKK